MTTTDEKWIERIRQWKESGKTADEFAAGQSFKASTLKWRAAGLRRSAEGGDRHDEGRAPIRMARVVSRGRSDAGLGTGGVIIEVSGVRIALARGFDAKLLIEVVRVLGAAR